MKKRWIIFTIVVIFTILSICAIDSESVIPTICSFIGIGILALYAVANRR